MVDARLCLDCIPVSLPVSSLFSFLLGRDAAGEMMLSPLRPLQEVVCCLEYGCGRNFRGPVVRRYIVILGVLTTAKMMMEQDVVCPHLLSARLPLLRPRLLNQVVVGGHYCRFGVVMGPEIDHFRPSFSY